MRFVIIFTLIFIKSSWAICLLQCNTTKCAQLEYYLKKCKKCTKIGTKCRKAFCQNHSQWCQEGHPIKILTVATNEMSDQSIDICLGALFVPFKFNDHNNTALNINNLNMANIKFFAQTKGEAKQRNMGAIENILVNYLLYIQPDLRKLSEDDLKAALESWIKETFHMSLEKANNFQYHMMIEHVRRDLYKRKGIPTQEVIEYYNNQKYPVTISKLGCITETAFKDK